MKVGGLQGRVSLRLRSVWPLYVDIIVYNAARLDRTVIGDFIVIAHFYFYSAQPPTNLNTCMPSVELVHSSLEVLDYYIQMLVNLIGRAGALSSWQDALRPFPPKTILLLLIGKCTPNLVSSCIAE